MTKDSFKVTGTVTNMGELIHIERTSIPDLYKRVLTVEMDDGQVFYPEVRNQRLKLLEREFVEKGCRIDMEFTFQGSEKNGKRYNNIYVTSIKRIA